MLFATRELAAKYDYLAPKFKIGYDFLMRDDLATLPVGKIDLADGVFVQVQEYTSKIPSTARFESHDKYFDIQYVAAGEETFGIAHREGLEIDTPYSPEKDISFYREPAVSGLLYLRAGDTVVVAPEEAHKPSLSVNGKQGQVKKLVVKVPV